MPRAVPKEVPIELPYRPSQGGATVPCASCRAICSAVLHEVLIDMPYQLHQANAELPDEVAQGDFPALLAVAEKTQIYLASLQRRV